MKHKIGYNKLSRKQSHRKALIRNMVTSFFEYERITTTKAKAKEVSRKAEKMITKAKVDSVHNRRIASRFLYKESTVAKLFTEISPRFISRNGGYTRIIKKGYRQGDAAELVILELVERKLKDKKAKKEEPKKKADTVQAKTISKTSAKDLTDKVESEKIDAKKESVKSTGKVIEKSEIQDDTANGNGAEEKINNASEQEASTEEVEKPEAE